MLKTSGGVWRQMVGIYHRYALFLILLHPLKLNYYSSRRVSF